MKKELSLAVILIFCFTVASFAQTKQVGKHLAKKWLNSKHLLNGKKLKASKSVDVKEFARQYSLNKNYWDKTFEFLEKKDLDQIAKGKYPVDGDKIFASVTIDSTKNFDKTNWESHKKFIDIQYVISGEEKMGVCPVSKATVTKPYDEKRDAANYSAEGKIYTAAPGTYFIFFPGDAHRPNITPGGNKPDKKIVIKIPYTE